MVAIYRPVNTAHRRHSETRPPETDKSVITRPRSASSIQILTQMTTQNLFTIINYISKFHLDPSLTHSPPRADPSICLVSSSSPEIFLRSSVSTRSTTRSARVYTVGPRLPCGPPTSCAEADTASWMWIEPTSADASFGQNRAREYDARPSIEESCG